MKKPERGAGMAWAMGALRELHRVIDQERDNQRWLMLQRATGRVQDAIEEADKIAIAAVDAEKRLARQRRRR